MKNILTLSTLLFLLFSTALFAETNVYPPALRAPLNGEPGQVPDVNMDWDAVTGETLNITYELQLATNADFSDATVFDRTDLTAMQMSELLFGQIYFWRVKAFDDADPSDWSETWSFTTANFVNIKKPDIGSEVFANPLVTWDKLSGLTGYQLQLDTVSVFVAENSGTGGNINATFVGEDGDRWAVGDDGLVLHFEDSQWVTLDAGTTSNINDVFFVSNTDGYLVGDGGLVVHFDGTVWSTLVAGTTNDLNGVWFADANTGWVVGAGGVTLKYDAGVWAEETTDNTNDLLDVFVVNSTNVWACGASKTIAHYDGTAWSSESVGTKDFYSLWFVDENSGWAVGKSGRIFYFNGTEWVQQAAGTNDDLFSLSFEGTTGYALGESGTMIIYNGEWAAMASGFDDDLLGVFSSDDNTLFGGKDGFLSFSSEEGFNSPYTKLIPIPFDSGSYELSNLLFGENFYYRMRAFHDEDTSEWSGPWSMTTLASPVLESPNNGVSDTDLSLLFKWKEYEGATEYIYQIAADENFSFPFSLNMDTNSVGVSVTLFGLEYYWHVRAMHPDDISDWSDTRTFTTVNTVTLDSPEDGAEDVNTCPKFTWEEIEGVPEYEIAIDVDENFSDPRTDIVETNFSQCNESMEKNTVYYWKVRGVTGLDSSDWSATWSLKIEGYIGFDDNFSKHSIQLYPNPNTGEFSVSINSLSGEMYALTVTDLLGKVLLERNVACFPGENKINIKLEDLNKGIYLLNVRKEEQVVTKKLFIR